MAKFVIIRIPGFHNDFRRTNPIPNLGVGFLAGVAKEEGYTVSILEGHMWIDTGYLSENLSYVDRLSFFLKEVEAEAPDVLGISVLSGDLALGIEFAKLYKAKNPETFILMGGVGVNGVASIIARYLGSSLDVIVEGEGEYTLREILKEIAKKKPKRDFSVIKGISYKQGDRWVHNPRRPLIKYLDTLPLVTLEEYKYLPPSIITLLPVERGCPSACRFCFATETWGKGRYFGLNRIKKQGKILLSFQKTIKRLFLSDSNILAQEKIGEETLRFILANFPEAIGSINLRVDQTNPGLIELFSQHPQVSPLFGIESLSPKLLLYLGKTDNPENYMAKVKESLDQFKKNHIDYCLSLIYHIPGETREDLEELYNFLLDQDPDRCRLLYMSKLWLEGNTALWQDYKRGKLEIFSLYKPSSSSLGEQYNDIIFEPFSFLIRNPLISEQYYYYFANKSREIFQGTPCCYLG